VPVVEAATAEVPLAAAAAASAPSVAAPLAGPAVLPPAPALELSQSVPAVLLAEDERLCESCGCAIKKDALKCRFCGSTGGAPLNSWTAPPPEVQAQINDLAGSALGYGIGCFFCLGPILATIAITRGNKAIRMLEGYPAGAGGGKARAGVVLGWINWAIFVIYILATISAASR
jgi:hypothetical protein